MGAWVLASVFYACFLLSEAENSSGATSKLNIYPILVRLSRQNPGSDTTKQVLVEGGIHSAVPVEDNAAASATNYEPYDVKLYNFEAEDARNNYPLDAYGNDVGGYENEVNYREFSSIEAEANGYNQNLDTTGYEHYKTATSFSLEGPKQLETITTQSFHKEVEPYDVSEFQKHHKEDEEHAEVHYHQHKHLHKHNHKQEHVHKHQQEHKHDHGHKHDHYAQHEHKHDAQHKHEHYADHKHNHKAEHLHKHNQHHKHSHYAQHKHGHKHNEDHKHDQYHQHKHRHEGYHKHSHYNDHKHNHHHGHRHENQHKHKHDHYADHKHKHQHRDEHKHIHQGQHYQKHYYKYKY